MNSDDIKNKISLKMFSTGWKIQIDETKNSNYQNPDLLLINAAGKVSEIEIKISRSDFQKEFKEKKHKHERLDKNKYPVNYFYYACPRGPLNEEEIPKYAGLIEISQRGAIIITKRAPLLSKKRFDDFQLIRSIAISLTERRLFNGKSYQTFKKQGNRNAAKKKPI